MTKKRLFVALAILLITVLALLLWRNCGRNQTKQDTKTHAQTQAQRAGSNTRPKPDELGPDGLPASATVLGTITDLEGTPLAEARICARNSRSRIAQPRCTLSDDEGRYLLAGLAPDSYMLTVSAAEHQPKSEQLELWAGAELERDFELLAGGVLVRGVVLDLAGGAIEGAIVLISNDAIVGDPGHRALASSDEHGQFEAWVRRGRLRVTAQATGYSRRWLYSTAPGPTIELYLVPEAVLVGRVVDADTGAGVGGVEVLPGIGGGGVLRFYTAVDGGWAATEADGSFRIAGLTPGPFRPFVANGHWRGQSEQTVKLGLGETSSPIEVPVVRGATVRAQVVDEDGEPACVAEQVTISPAMLESYVATVDSDGWIEFGGLPPGDYAVTFHCRGRMIKEVGDFSLEDGDLDDLRWVVPRGLDLRGTIVDSGGQPVPGVVVVSMLIPDADDERGPTARRARSEPSEKDGSFVFRGLEPGAYELELGGSSGPKLDEPVEVELRSPGLDGVRLEVPVAAELRGRVVAEGDANTGIPNLTITAYGQSGGWQDTRSDDEGRFVLRDLGPDRYRVVALDGRWQVELAEGSVELEAGGHGELELAVPRHDGVIRGRVVDDGGTPIDDAFISVTRQAEALDKSAAADRLSYSDAKGRPVLTDPDGLFEVRELPAGLYTVWAKQKQGGEATLVDVRPGQRVELMIAAVASVAGTVALPGVELGAVDFSITATLADGSFEFNDQWQNPDGAWRFEDLSPGRYTLRASSDLGDGQLELELAPGVALEDQRIELEPRVTLRGRIVAGEDRSPIPGARVRALRPEVSQFGGPGFVDWVDCDEGGRFELVVPTGEIELEIVPPGSVAARRHQGASERITVAAEPDVQEVGELALEPL